MSHGNLTTQFHAMKLSSVIENLQTSKYDATFAAESKLYVHEYT